MIYFLFVYYRILGFFGFTRWIRINLVGKDGFSLLIAVFQNDYLNVFTFYEVIKRVKNQFEIYRIVPEGINPITGGFNFNFYSKSHTVNDYEKQREY